MDIIDYVENVLGLKLLAYQKKMLIEFAKRPPGTRYVVIPPRVGGSVALRSLEVLNDLLKGDKMATSNRTSWLINELAKEAEARLKGDITKGYTYEPEPREKFQITKVIFNPPATIVYFSDGSKSVVKCGENDIFDPEKGLAMAITKRCMGNTGRYFNTIKKWTEPWYEENAVSEIPNTKTSIDEVIERLRKSCTEVSFGIGQPAVEKHCDNCKYVLIPGYEHPCAACLSAVGRPLWEPKDSCQSETVKKTCDNCACRYWHEAEKPCHKCVIMTAGSVPSHWQSEDD